MPVLGANQKLVVVLVLIVLVVTLVLGIVIGRTLQIVPPNLKTQSFNWYGWQGVGENPNAQLLDAESYATSWSSNDGSEKIVIQGGVTQPGALSFSCIQEGQYQVWLSRDGITWTQVAGSPFKIDIGSVLVGPGGSVAWPAFTYVYYGPYSGEIKVDQQAHIRDVGAPFTSCSIGIDKGFLTVAEDQAYITSSSYTISADQQGQIGQTVSASVSVGFLTSKTGGPGWKFWAYSTAQNRVVLGPFESGTSQWSQLTQRFSYTITPSDFSANAGTCGNGNRIEWHLYNELFPKPVVWTTTIDVTSYAPSFAFDGYSGNPVSNGSILVKFHAAPNPTTQATIRGIVLQYSFGVNPQILNLSANATSYTISLGQNGNLHVEGYSIDTACRPSPSQRLDIYVYPAGQNPPGIGPPNWLLFFAVVAIFAVVGVVVAYLAKGAPIWARVLVAVTILLLGILLAVIMQPKVIEPTTWTSGLIPLARSLWGR